MRTLLTVLAIVAGIYLAIALAAWAAQGQLIYPALRGQSVPEESYEVVALPTADGLELRVFWREGEPGKPVVLYFHGNGGTLAGSTQATRALVAAGFSVLLPAYRGYEDNEGTPHEKGLYTDGRAALAWLADKGVAPENLVVIGNSIGTGPAMQMASEVDPLALILISPFTSLPEIAASKMPILPMPLLLRDRYDNSAKIGSLDMPILIQAGSADTLIPATHGRALARLAPDADLQIFDGLGHDLNFRPETDAARVRWLEAEVLQPTAPATPSE
ncbi:alpha/beta hydrolase [Erythrobacter litoralis]|uniref:AB hydrolase-1 domain-containing protein n=1 Tax=Erythrobacter litoralis (strain HTCC2594) TaxID=314225 RepID=Q2N6U6_ERYLH|nr:alpha/beta hydrolase [Erythrobacter litoralis]ABC64595.1 hypothetical protein ELI_12515 [Erythrobacter litoralis HTCC2594]